MTSVQFDGTEQPAGQPASASPQNTTPPALTQDQIEALRLIVREETAKSYRALQSSQSKQEKRIKDFVQQQLSAAQAEGQEVTPQLEKALTRAAREQLLSDSDDEPAAQPAQVAAPKPAPQKLDPSEAFSTEQGEIFDVEPLNDSDPEAALLKGATDFKSWKRLVVQATQAKAERLAQSPTPPTKPIPNAVGAAGVDTQASLTDAYKAEVLANRGKGYRVLDQIKDKYAKLGLDLSAGVSFR
jgi:hypothetical protein